MIDSKDYYGEYFGHKTEHLQIIIENLRPNHSEIIWLAGDSSLDNKYWFSNTSTLKNGMESIIRGQGKPDICHHLNSESVKRNLNCAAINCAIEATRLESRACGCLLKQDNIIKNNINHQDTLVVSIGGNDIALLPSPMTILSILSLICCTPTSCIENYSCGCAVPMDDYCCGCCTSSLSCFTAFPIGLGYFIHLFQIRIEAYIKRLTARTKPRRVIVCMIYYPDEAPGNSWADGTLSLLGYNTNPSKLQALIRKMFKLATQKINIPGIEVIGLPLFDVLDATDTNDYCQRVEPSPIGGKKIANAILDIISNDHDHRINSRGLTDISFS